MYDDESTDASTTPATGGQATDSAGGQPAPRKRTVKKATKATESAPAKPTAKKSAAKKATATEPAEPPAVKKAAKATKATKPAKTTKGAKAAKPGSDEPATVVEGSDSSAGASPAKTTAAKRTRRPARVVAFSAPEGDVDAAAPTAAPSVPLIFKAPDADVVAAKSAAKGSGKSGAKGSGKGGAKSAADSTSAVEPSPTTPDAAAESGAGPDGQFESDADGEGGSGRRRRRGGRGRKRRPETGSGEERTDGEAASGRGDSDSRDGSGDGDAADDASSSTRRRRRRSRGGADGESHLPDDPPNTVVRVRKPAAKSSAVSLKGSTRLEAKKQRRREGRDAGRRRPAILTEAEFLARRESVDRVMLVRDRDGRIQIAVLEDGVLVEHYVNRTGSSSMVGSVYLGKVQNVLPSMEAAFVDVGRGRNAVLYAGEVNWDAAGLEGQAKRIESALKSGDDILVQVTKDPVGHKGSRLTSQISLPGRFLVYVPSGSMTGISRKLPEAERTRLKGLLRRLIPEGGGVIVRTAAEGASEEELVDDVNRLVAQWEQIQDAAKAAAKSVPALLHGEPDLAIKIVRDIFNEDFNKLIVSGSGVWDAVEEYVVSVAPDLVDRLEKWVGPKDVFSEYRIDEQLAKGLDRKVFLPSGGSLVIDRTEAMTVVDVNTGKFTGQGGNLEETVTRNNIEAAEEVVRQLRLRDIGGIIVIDFIDMVLESNREAVLRRLVECLGRDRTKHQVAEVTSLGLVQMTRKRLGQGLLEVFSEPCDCCNGRGVKILSEPAQDKSHDAVATPPSRRSRRGNAPAAEVTVVETPPAVLAAIESIAEAAAHSHLPNGAGEPPPEGAQGTSADLAVDGQVEADRLTKSAPVEPAPTEALEAPVTSAPPGPASAGPRPRRRRAATRPAGPATTGGNDPV